MIFVTVGAQMPFDRLVRTVDEWAEERARDDVFAQIGPTRWRPSRVSFERFLTSKDFFEKMESATIVVAHAGVGTILSALQRRKPILVMPRRSDLQETRNNHQLATAKRLCEAGKIEVAFDEFELRKKLDSVETIEAPPSISSYASQELLEAVRKFIDES
jgi:UDP-N-acetylglucosamine transferase subunit ALG13